MGTSEAEEIRIGGDTVEFVSIRRLGPNRDREWFRAEIEVQCDGWRGKFHADFMHGELARFAEQLEELYQALQSHAILNPIEAPLKLTFVGNGKGHIEVTGTAQTNWVSGTRLEFFLNIDQTFLPSIAQKLRAADPT